MGLSQAIILPIIETTSNGIRNAQKPPKETTIPQMDSHDWQTTDNVLKWETCVRIGGIIDLFVVEGGSNLGNSPYLHPPFLGDFCLRCLSFCRFCLSHRWGFFDFSKRHLGEELYLDVKHCLSQVTMAGWKKKIMENTHCTIFCRNG